MQRNGFKSHGFGQSSGVQWLEAVPSGYQHLTVVYSKLKITWITLSCFHQHRINNLFAILRPTFKISSFFLKQYLHTVLEWDFNGKTNFLWFKWLSLINIPYALIQPLNSWCRLFFRKFHWTNDLTKGLELEIKAFTNVNPRLQLWLFIHRAKASS